jgi:hypothetical protein
LKKFWGTSLRDSFPIAGPPTHFSQTAHDFIKIQDVIQNIRRPNATT